jgi:hypothetical protein
MKYTVWMGSGTMIHIPRVMKNGSGIQKFFGGGRIHVQAL